MRFCCKLSTFYDLKLFDLRDNIRMTISKEKAIESRLAVKN
jgi:hypothetical protein